MAFSRFAKLALIGAAAITVPAWGSPVVWTLQNAALQPGGGSLSGNFTYDADSNTYSNWSITVTGATSYSVTTLPVLRVIAESLGGQKGIRFGISKRLHPRSKRLH